MNFVCANGLTFQKFLSFSVTSILLLSTSNSSAEFILPPSSCSANIQHFSADMHSFEIDHAYRRGAGPGRHEQLKVHLTYTLRCHHFGLSTWPERQRSSVTRVTLHVKCRARLKYKTTARRSFRLSTIQIYRNPHRNPHRNSHHGPLYFVQQRVLLHHQGKRYIVALFGIKFARCIAMI